MALLGLSAEDDAAWASHRDLAAPERAFRYPTWLTPPIRCVAQKFSHRCVVGVADVAMRCRARQQHCTACARRCSQREQALGQFMFSGSRRSNQHGAGLYRPNGVPRNRRLLL